MASELQALPFVAAQVSLTAKYQKRRGPASEAPENETGTTMPHVSRGWQIQGGSLEEEETKCPRDFLRAGVHRRFAQHTKHVLEQKRVDTDEKKERGKSGKSHETRAAETHLLNRIWRLATSLGKLQAFKEKAAAEIAEKDSQISVLSKLLTLWNPAPTMPDSEAVVKAELSSLQPTRTASDLSQQADTRIDFATPHSRATNYMLPSPWRLLSPMPSRCPSSSSSPGQEAAGLPTNLPRATPPPQPGAFSPFGWSAHTTGPAASQGGPPKVPRLSPRDGPACQLVPGPSPRQVAIAPSLPTVTSDSPKSHLSACRGTVNMRDLKGFTPVAPFVVVPSSKEFTWRNRSQRRGRLGTPLKELIWQNTIVEREAERLETHGRKEQRNNLKQRLGGLLAGRTLSTSSNRSSTRERDVESDGGAGEGAQAGQKTVGSFRHRRKSSVSSDALQAVSKVLRQVSRGMSDASDDDGGRTSMWKTVTDKVAFCMRGGKKEKELVEEETRPSFLPLYRRICRVVMTALFDLVALLVFRVAWVDTDPTCRVVTAAAGAPRKAVPRDEFLVTITLIHFLHLLDIWVRMCEKDANRRRMMFRIFYSTRAPNSSFKAMASSLEALTLFLMVAFTWIHRALCHLLVDENHQSELRVLQRVDLLLHAIRCMQAMQRCYMLHTELQKRIQTLVSLNKRRFIDQDHQLDLDLTYIADRVIAMAVPCVDHALHRNDIREVSRFFATRHYGKFMVFNLCEDHEEKGNGNYDVKLLYGQVEKLPFIDHNAPRLHTIVNFCEQATAWLNRSSENVVAIHCRGGKGRTGTMVSSLLLWTMFRTSASDALETFAERRTFTYRTKSEMQRVAAPSQLRYVDYLGQLMYKGVDYVSKRWRIISRVTLHTTPMHHKELLRVLLFIESGTEVVYDYVKAHGVKQIKRDNPARDTWHFDVGEVLVAGDVTVRTFYLEDDARSSEDTHVPQFLPGRRSVKYGSGTARQLCFVSFHTSFHDDDSLFFPKADVDGAYDKHSSKFLDTFGVSVDFCDAHLLQSCHRAHNDALHRHHSSHHAASETQTADTASSHHTTELDSHGREARPTQVDGNHDEEVGSRGAGSFLHHDVRMKFGLPAVQRYMQSHEATKVIMRSACPELWEFKKGDVVFNPQVLPSTNARTLFYIVQGNAKWSLHQSEVAAPAKIGFGWSLRGTGLGAGEFFGVLQFFLDDFQDQHAVLVANTDTVLVRRLEVPYDDLSLTSAIEDHGKESRFPHIPVTLPGCSTASTATVFELLAKQTARRAHDLIMGGQQTNHIISNVKSDVYVSSRETERRHTAAKIVRRHNMSLEEHLRDAAPVRFTSCSRTLHSLKEIKGTVYVFRTFMAISSIKLWYNQRKEVVFPFRCVQDTSLDGATLRIRLTREMASRLRRISLGEFHAEDASTQSEEGSRPIRSLSRLTNGLRGTMRNLYARTEHDADADELEDVQWVSLRFKDPSAANRIRHNITQRVAAIALDLQNDSEPATRLHSSRSFKLPSRYPPPLSPSQSNSPAGRSPPVQRELATHFSRRSAGSPVLREPLSPGQRSPTATAPSTRDNSWVARGHGQAEGSSSLPPQARRRSSPRQSCERRRESNASHCSAFSAFSAEESLQNFSRKFGFVLADEVVDPSEEVALEGLFSKSKVSRYQNKEVILKQGSTERLLFHIVSGHVKVVAGGRLVASLSEGNVFGEVSFLETGNFGARSDVVADGEVEVVVISHDSIEILAALQPSIGARFYRSLAVSSAKRLQKQYAEMFRRVSLLAEGSAKHHQTYTGE